MIVRITDDFNLDKIADSGQCFRWTKTDDHTYRIIAGESCLYITELADDCYDLSCTQEEYDNKWEDYFDLREDYRSIRERIDPGFSRGQPNPKKEFASSARIHGKC